MPDPETEPAAIPLSAVIARLWAIIRGRHGLHDNTGYSWSWRDIIAHAGEGNNDGTFLGETRDD